MRGTFLQNFINVLLGFVLVTFLPGQLFGPPPSDFVSHLVSNEIAKHFDKNNLLVSGITEKVISCAQRCASDYKHQPVNPFTIDKDYTDLFCRHLEVELTATSLSQTDSIGKDLMSDLITWARNVLLAECQARRFLFFAIAVFVVKYLHELSRVEDLFHVGVLLPSWMNFVHFLCSHVLAAAIILLILNSGILVPWWLLAGMFFGFFVNDVTLIFAKVMKRLERSVARGRGVQWRIITTWVFLDLLILLFILVYKIANSPVDPAWMSWNDLLAWLLLIQVAFPYIVGFDFYFKDYKDEAVIAKAIPSP